MASPLLLFLPSSLAAAARLSVSIAATARPTTYVASSLARAATNSSFQVSRSPLSHACGGGRAPSPTVLPSSLISRSLTHSFSSSSSPPPGDGSGEEGSGAAEQHLVSVLRSRFPGATDIAVVDVSGGCGAMYEVYLEAEEFRGSRLVKQHQMVTQALKEEIKDMHGLRISTAVPPKTGGGGDKGA